MALGLAVSPVFDKADELTILNTICVYIASGVFMVAYGCNTKQDGSE